MDAHTSVQFFKNKFWIFSSPSLTAPSFPSILQILTFRWTFAAFLSQKETRRKGYKSTASKSCTHLKTISAYLCYRKTLQRSVVLTRLEPGRSFRKILEEMIYKLSTKPICCLQYFLNMTSQCQFVLLLFFNFLKNVLWSIWTVELEYFMLNIYFWYLYSTHNKILFEVFIYPPLS